MGTDDVIRPSLFIQHMNDLTNLNNAHCAYLNWKSLKPISCTICNLEYWYSDDVIHAQYDRALWISFKNDYTGVVLYVMELTESGDFA